MPVLVGCLTRTAHHVQALETSLRKCSPPPVDPAARMAETGSQQRMQAEVRASGSTLEVGSLVVHPALACRLAAVWFQRPDKPAWNVRRLPGALGPSVVVGCCAWVLVSMLPLAAPPSRAVEGRYSHGMASQLDGQRMRRPAHHPAHPLPGAGCAGGRGGGPADGGTGAGDCGHQRRGQAKVAAGEWPVRRARACVCGGGAGGLWRGQLGAAALGVAITRLAALEPFRNGRGSTAQPGACNFGGLCHLRRSPCLCLAAWGTAC